MGSLLTGLLISWKTPWGFFKWRWVTAKWVLTITMTLFGIFYLSPWLHEMSGGPMFLAMLFLIFLSVIKPWGKRNRGGLSQGGAQPEISSEPQQVL